MDEPSLLRYIDERRNYFGEIGCEQLLGLLNYNEYVDIEDRKTCLFSKRVDYAIMAQCFKDAILRESEYKQVKRYLKKYCGMREDMTQKNADKINLACRVFNNLTTIIRNCTKWGVDIRELTLKELSLAIRSSWVLKRSALSKLASKVPEEAKVQINHASVERSIDEILHSDWYLETKDNPALLAIINEQDLRPSNKLRAV